MYQNGCFKIGKKSAILKEISHPHEDRLKMAPKRFSDSPTDSKEFPVPAKRRSLTKRESSNENNEEDFVAVKTKLEPKTFFAISTFEDSKTDYKKLAKAQNLK